MATPTNYLSNGTDLSSIFYPLSSGGVPAETATGYLYNTGSGYSDLNTLFSAYFIDSDTADETGFISSAYDNSDLNQIFQSINSVPNYYSITSENSYISNSFTTYTIDSVYYYVLTLSTTNIGLGASYTTGTCNITFNFSTSNLSYIIVGGGGGGGFSAGIYGAGGGGGGETSIGTVSITAGIQYSVQVGSGGDIYINGNQNGVESYFDVNNASGGNQGVNSSSSSSGTGGSSNNGGSGGDGSTGDGNVGIDGDYSSYVTPFNVTFNLGGGGGGGGGGGTNSGDSNGYPSENGIGGAGGTASENQNGCGTTYGAGGGGGGGFTSGGLGQAGGSGGSGVVILYWTS
jgi:hypothetical protein